jgi:uncharacterized protein YgfB (UPF0149 family)
VTGPSYADIEQALGGAAGAAETHGTLVGLLSTAADDLPGSWIANTLADATEGLAIPTAVERDVLVGLYEATTGALTGEELAFVPLLPEDEEPLEARVEALAGWCQGYLYGLAVRGLRNFDDLPDDVREILVDLAQIAQAGHDDDSDDEGAERAYVELVEYVRVGAQLVYDQLMPPARTDHTEPL